MQGQRFFQGVAPRPSLILEEGATPYGTDVYFNYAQATRILRITIQHSPESGVLVGEPKIIFLDLTGLSLPAGYNSSFDRFSDFGGIIAKGEEFLLWISTLGSIFFNANSHTTALIPSRWSLNPILDSTLLFSGNVLIHQLNPGASQDSVLIYDISGNMIARHDNVPKNARCFSAHPDGYFFITCNYSFSDAVPQFFLYHEDIGYCNAFDNMGMHGYESVICFSNDDPGVPLFICLNYREGDGEFSNIWNIEDVHNPQYVESITLPSCGRAGSLRFLEEAGYTLVAPSSCSVESYVLK